MNLDELFIRFETPTQNDLKLNFKKFFESANLTKKDAGLVTLACAHTINCVPLQQFASSFLTAEGCSPEEIQEAVDISAMMGIANCYYRFRHFVKKDSYQKAAGFRMSVLMRPVNGKLSQELMSTAVSIINGCETCVEGHEKSVLEHGGSEEIVHDVARLASTINGLGVIFRTFK